MPPSKNSTRLSVNFKRSFKVYKTKEIDRSITLAAVHKRFHGVCVDCNTDTELGIHPVVPHSATIEHITPLSKGGNHVWSNIELLCYQCNSKRNQTQQKIGITKRFNLFGYYFKIRITKDLK